MKLLLENWRKYLSEEEEQPDTTEQKLQSLFFNNAAQAMHLAEQVEVDEELMKLMRAAVEAAHDIIRGYLYYAEGEIKRDEYGELIVNGDGTNTRAANTKDDREQFKKALEGVGKYGKDEGFKLSARSEHWEAGHRLSRLFNHGIFRLIVIPSRIKGEPKEEEAYKEAVEWAGTPQQ